MNMNAKRNQIESGNPLKSERITFELDDFVSFCLSVKTVKCAHFNYAGPSEGFKRHASLKLG